MISFFKPLCVATLCLSLSGCATEQGEAKFRAEQVSAGKAGAELEESVDTWKEQKEQKTANTACIILLPLCLSLMIM